MAKMSEREESKTKETISLVAGMIGVGIITAALVPSSAYLVSGIIEASGHPARLNYERAKPVIERYLKENNAPVAKNLDYFGHSKGHAIVLVDNTKCIGLESTLDRSINPIGNLTSGGSVYHFSGAVKLSEECKHPAYSLAVWKPQ